MKIYIVYIVIIIVEALGYGWLLGEENEKLQAENAMLQQKITMTNVENSKLQWELLLAKAGVPDEE